MVGSPMFAAVKYTAVLGILLFSWYAAQLQNMESYW